MNTTVGTSIAVMLSATDRRENYQIKKTLKHAGKTNLAVSWVQCVQHRTVAKGTLMSAHTTNEKPFEGAFSSDYIMKALLKYRSLLKDPDITLIKKSIVYEHLSKMFHQLGEVEKAVAFLNLAIFADPTSESAYKKKIERIDAQSLPKRLFSVVIPTFNHYRDLVQCVENIRRNSFFPVQIIVVCDKCNDGTVEFVLSQNGKKDFIGVVNEAHLGPIPSMKFGLHTAQGDYIATINDDVKVMPGWDLEIFLTIDADSSAGCAVPLVVYADGTAQSVGQHNNYRSSKYDWIGRVPSFNHEAAVKKNLLELPHFQSPRECDYGYFPVVKRDCLHAIGYVDDAYRHYFVDPDMGYLIQQHGWKNIYCPTSVLVHYEKSVDEHGMLGVQLKARPDCIRFFKKWGIITS